MVDSFQIGARQTRLTEHVVDVVTITLVSRHTTRGGVWLFDVASLFKLAHHVAKRRRTPAEAV